MDIYGLFSPFGKRLAIKININQSNTYDFETLIGLANILRDLLDVLDEVTSAHFVSVYIALISASKITKWLRRGKMSGGKGVWSRLVTFGHIWSRLATFSRKHVTRQPVAIWSECISQIGTPQ